MESSLDFFPFNTFYLQLFWHSNAIYFTLVKPVKNDLAYFLRMRDSYTNPSETKRIKSFEIFGLTKRIHETNLWKTGLRNESAIRSFQKHVYKMNPRNKSLRFGFANPPAWIRKDSFRAIVLSICQDSWGFVGFVKTGRIFGSSGHEMNPRFKSLKIGLANPDSQICEVRFVNHETKQIFF